MMNPELQRNLWLELTQHRLLGMPLVLGLIFWLAWVLDDHGVENLHYAAAWIFVILTLFWGGRQAAECVLAEISGRTWDWQRLSGLSPWSMTWGKLLGSTAYVWYGGLFCIAVYFISGLNLTGNSGQVYEAEKLLRNTALLVLLGLLIQGMAMLFSLQFLRRQRQFTSRHTTAVHVLALVLVAPLFSGLAKLRHVEMQNWYGMAFDMQVILLASVAVFLLWTICGIYYLLRAELQFRNQPLTWLGFVLFVMAYAGGFVGNFTEALLLYYLIASVAVYALLLLEDKDPVHYRYCYSLWQQQKWFDFFCALPRWLVSWALLPVLLFALLFVLNLDGGHKGFSDWLAVLAAFFFTLRDIALVLFLNVKADSRRADLAALIYLSLLYGIFPLIMEAMDLDKLVALFWPQREAVWLSIGAALLQALLFWSVLWWRVQQATDSALRNPPENSNIISHES